MNIYNKINHNNTGTHNKHDLSHNKHSGRKGGHNQVKVRVRVVVGGTITSVQVNRGADSEAEARDPELRGDLVNNQIACRTTVGIAGTLRHMRTPRMGYAQPRDSPAMAAGEWATYAGYVGVRGCKQGEDNYRFRRLQPLKVQGGKVRAGRTLNEEVIRLRVK